MTGMLCPASSSISSHHPLRETPLSREALRNYFVEGIKKEEDLRIGVEWEKIGVYKENGKAISYSGPRGVETIFRSLIQKFAWEPVFSGQAVTALKKNDSSITLEPGGQIELSGRKAERLDENAQELFDHLSEIKEVSEPLGIAWLGTGLQPVSVVDKIEWVPKRRYTIMKENLKDKGSLSHAMMKQTASIQISLDYTGERDAIKKLRLAMGLAPLFCAIFANSPVSEGRLNGFHSRRAAIWMRTAPERSGWIPGVFRPGFGFDDYVEYALGVPMIFIVRHGEWVTLPNLTFREFLKNGFRDYHPTIADWELHLTTIFTETRLKKYIEIRTIDCQKKTFGLSAPALVKGLFYDETSRKAAWELVSENTLDERRKLFEEAAVHGLGAKFKNTTLLEPATRLLELAEEGLRRLAAKDPARVREPSYLEPLKELLAHGKNPADIVIEQLRRDPALSLPQLLSL